MINNVKPTTKPVVTPVKNLPTVASSIPTFVENDKEKLPPLEDRLLKLNQLFEIQTKYNRLLKSKNLLNEFKLKKDSETLTLSLSDYQNRSVDFSTKNVEVIEVVINCLKTTIDDKIKSLEPKLNW